MTIFITFVSRRMRNRPEERRSRVGPGPRTTQKGGPHRLNHHQSGAGICLFKKCGNLGVLAQLLRVPPFFEEHLGEFQPHRELSHLGLRLLQQSRFRIPVPALQPLRPTLQERPPPRIELMCGHLQLAAHRAHALSSQQTQHHVCLRLRIHRSGSSASCSCSLTTVIDPHSLDPKK